MTIAKRSAIDIIRMRNARPIEEELYDETDDLGAAAAITSPIDIEGQVVDSMTVASVIAEYGAKTRNPERIYLFCQVLLGEMTMIECAKALDIPEGTVKSGINTMRRFVKSAIGPQSL